ncbi:MAG: hypothetical protein LBV69_06390 [Bacteroidales bacterium]|nr:hypothetical protein [Bacteroidales bacterium]
MLDFFFKPPKHKTFNYQTRFYDAEAESRKKKLDALRAGKDNSEIEYVPGSIIKSQMASTTRRKHKRKKGSTTRSILIIFFLIFAVWYLYNYGQGFLSVFFSK